LSPSPRSGATDTFGCLQCGRAVSTAGPERLPRDHCPHCLYSRHLTDLAGGGPSPCGQRMAPIAIAVAGDGAWSVIHRCTHCREVASAPAGPDDNPLVLTGLAVRPFARPPFPLDALGAL
jgi:hypothetical protein